MTRKMDKCKLMMPMLLVFLFPAFFFIAGCSSVVDPNDLQTVENNVLIIPDLIHYFEKNKIPIDKVELIRADVAHANDAVAIKIAGREIGIYKYNVNIRKQREKLAHIETEKFLYLVGIKCNVLINGSFVMVGWEGNPQKELLAKVFMSFSPKSVNNSEASTIKR
ncbi:MAG: hypothetical protein PHQ27_00040 [Victivallales bacterium]|nr:hypothetical protein [Victivallales bacterium]